MMSYFQKMPIFPQNKNTHFLTKRIFTEAPSTSQRRSFKLSLSQLSTSRSQTSCLSRDWQLYIRKKNTFHQKKTFSILSARQATENEEISAKTSEINNLVDKRNRALRIKYDVKNLSDPIPNILEIRQSVKKEELSFMRRMDKKLNSTGNAFLLNHMRKDLNIKFHNYLRETSDKTRKNRKYFIHSLRNANCERFVIMPCQITRDKISKK